MSKQAGLNRNEALSLASKLASEGKLDEARTLYHRIISSHPNFLPAVDAFISALPQFSLTQTGASQCIELYEQYEFSRALPLAIELSYLRKADANSFCLLGSIQVKLNNYKRAESAFRTALELDQHSKEAKLGLIGSIRFNGLSIELEKLCQSIIAEQPTQPEQYLILGMSLLEAGKYSKATNLLKTAIEQVPPQAAVHNMLGLVQQSNLEAEDAISCFQNAIQLDPEFAQAHYNLGCCFIYLENYQSAENSLRKAVACQARYPEAHYNLGQALLKQGKLREAAQSFVAAARENPKYLKSFLALAEVYIELEDPEKARLAISQAHRLDSKSAQGMTLLGKIFDLEGNHDEAIARYRDAVDLSPTNPVHHTVLCEALEKDNRLEALDAAIDRARSLIAQTDPNIEILHAAHLLRKKDYQGVLDALDPLAIPAQAPRSASMRASLLGQCHDRLGSYAEAFSHFDAANRISSAHAYDAVKLGGEYLEMVNLLAQSPPPIATKAFTPNSSRVSHPPIFMVGFPRSGTTLLDSILRSHSRISVLEERPLVNAITAAAPGYPRSFSDWDESTIEHLRELYFTERQKYLTSADNRKHIVDKLPLNIVHVGLIQKIFPDSRIILSVRHPCDCVLSCFMQAFRLNPAMTNFLDINRASTLYDSTMRIWHSHIDDTSRTHLVFYEKLIGDLESVVRQLLDFLNLEWEDAVTEYATTAQSRKRIRTPSYTQVVQPIYHDSDGRWEHYANDISTALPCLLQWADRWGYERPHWAQHI